LNRPNEFLHKIVRFLLAVIDELKRNLFHRQIQRSEMPDRSVPYLDLDLSAVVMDDDPFPDDLIRSLGTGDR